MSNHVTRRSVNAGVGAALISPALSAPGFAQGSAPIKIGFSMALTGPLAVNGQQALLGAQIWAEEINAKGGLLGRQVDLIHYDDQSNPTNIPGIYTKLLDVDKVDLVIGPYATNMVAPAIPVVMQKGKVFIGLFALDPNAQFKYPRYFAWIPTSGAHPRQVLTEGFFQVAAAQNPKPQTLAITAEDAEFSRNAADGARANAKEYGFKIVYDKTYPPSTTDFSPVVRAIQASNPDLLVVCAYPLSAVGITLSVNELGFKPKMIGGAMVGLQAVAIKNKLKGKLNGIINYENWVPSPKLMKPAAAFFEKYQARAPKLGIDPLGYYLGGWGYSYLQVLAQAVEATKGLDDAKIATYLHGNAVNTIMIDGVRFDQKGEWVQARQLQVQYHDITDAANLETWRGMSYQTVLTPPDYATGKVIYPYAKALKA
ncbi:MAG: amino acid ABC transporter substrate-binding protein [Xanthobacteraceae bacterium]